MATGTVKFFNAQKGFGFIVQDGGGPDVFVHISAVERAGMSNLNEGQKLSFDIEADRKNGKSAAANLQAVYTNDGETPARKRRRFSFCPNLIISDRTARKEGAKEDAMAKKPGTNPKGEFVFFDVVYEDGSQRSNRRVPAELLGGLEKDAPALGFLIEQDREIAEKSGRAPLKIKSVARVGAKPEKMMKAG